MFKKKEPELIDFYRFSVDELGEIHFISLGRSEQLPVSSDGVKYIRIEDAIFVDPENVSLLELKHSHFSEWRPNHIAIRSLKIYYVPSSYLTEDRRVIRKEKRITTKRQLDFIIGDLKKFVVKSGVEIKTLNSSLESLNLIDSVVLQSLSMESYRERKSQLEEEIRLTVEEVEKYLKENSSEEVLRIMYG